MVKRTATLVGLIGLGAVLLGACSSGSSSSSTSATAGPTTTVAPSSSTTRASAPPPRPRTTSPGGPTQCPTPKLTATVYGQRRGGRDHRDHHRPHQLGHHHLHAGRLPGPADAHRRRRQPPHHGDPEGELQLHVHGPDRGVDRPGPGRLLQHGLLRRADRLGDLVPDLRVAGGHPAQLVHQHPVSAQLGPCGNGSITVSPVFLGTSAAAQTRAPPRVPAGGRPSDQRTGRTRIRPRTPPAEMVSSARPTPPRSTSESTMSSRRAGG